MAQQFTSIDDIEISDLIKSGAVGVLPTDTVYGLVCLASDHSAVSRLYGLKDRDNKPGTVIAADIQELVDLGLKPRYLKAVEQFWPGAISVLIPAGPELDYLHLKLFSLAVRIVDEPKLRKLLLKTGPLLTTSANLAGQAQANIVKEAKTYFNDKVDFYVDGGDLSGREPSTIIRIIDDAIEIVRAGAVKIDENGNKL